MCLDTVFSLKQVVADRGTGYGAYDQRCLAVAMNSAKLTWKDHLVIDFGPGQLAVDGV